MGLWRAAGPPRSARAHCWVRRVGRAQHWSDCTGSGPAHVGTAPAHGVAATVRETVHVVRFHVQSFQTTPSDNVWKMTRDAENIQVVHRKTVHCTGALSLLPPLRPPRGAVGACRTLLPTYVNGELG